MFMEGPCLDQNPIPHHNYLIVQDNLLMVPAYPVTMNVPVIGLEQKSTCIEHHQSMLIFPLRRQYTEYMFGSVSMKMRNEFVCL